MYNRYVNNGERDISAASEHESSVHTQGRIFRDHRREHHGPTAISRISDRLSELVGDQDLIFLLLIVFFLLYEEGEDITEIFLIIAVLLLIGL